MFDVAWHWVLNYVRSKDPQKQLAWTSLTLDRRPDWREGGGGAFEARANFEVNNFLKIKVITTKVGDFS